VGVVRGVSLPSPIDLTRRPYNTGHTTVWPCDIWPTVYWFNLQHNNYYSFTRLIYVLLLHYLGKQVDCIVITLATKVTHYRCIKLKKKYPVYPHSRSALEPEYHSKCLKCSFYPHRLEVSYAIHQQHHPQCFATLQRASIKRCLRSATSSTGVWYIQFLHHAPYSKANWIKIRDIRKP